MKTNITDLGKDKVSSLLFKLALPAIIAQMVNILYLISRIKNYGIILSLSEEI